MLFQSVLTRIILISLTFGGIQLMWAIQAANASVYFFQLGFSHSSVALIWLAGPISGLIAQPLINYWSDNCHSKWGRRKPFIFFGCILVIVCNMIYSSAIIFPLGSKTIAIIFFWILDFSINSVMAPLRAFMVDVTQAEDQALANSVFTLTICMGNILGFSLGTLPLSSFSFTRHYLQGVYLVANIFLLVFLFLTFLVSDPDPIFVSQNYENTQLLSNEFSTNSNATNSCSWCNFGDFYSNFKKFPSNLYYIFITQTFTWFSFFILFLYATDWIATDIFHGSSTASSFSPLSKAYKEGIWFSNLALCLQSILALFFTAILPYFLNKYYVKAYKYIWFYSQLLFAVLLCCIPIIHTIPGSIIIIILIGLPWSATLTIPWSLCSLSILHNPNQGLFLSIMNISQCIPQIICVIISLIFFNIHLSLPLFFFFSGVLLFISLFFINYVSYSSILFSLDTSL